MEKPEEIIPLANVLPYPCKQRQGKQKCCQNVCIIKYGFDGVRGFELC